MQTRAGLLTQHGTGKQVTGWGCPAIAFTPETNGLLLVQERPKWHSDVTFVDLRLRINSACDDIAGVPTTDSDNRVLKASTRDLFDVYKGTIDYLR